MRHSKLSNNFMVKLQLTFFLLWCTSNEHIPSVIVLRYCMTMFAHAMQPSQVTRTWFLAFNFEVRHSMFGERTLPNNDGNKILIPSQLRQLLLRSCSLAFLTVVSRNFADLLYSQQFSTKNAYFLHMHLV